MNRNQLVVVEGDRCQADPSHWHGSIEHAIASAIQSGFYIGRPVRLGQIHGHIIGYNIGNFGPYHGADFPLLVATALGIAKCAVNEIATV